MVEHIRDRQRPQAGELDRVLRRRHGTHVAGLLERQPDWARDFEDLSHEWRRLFAELLGTFLLVLVGAGGAVLEARTGTIGRAPSVVAMEAAGVFGSVPDACSCGRVRGSPVSAAAHAARSASNRC